MTCFQTTVGYGLRQSGGIGDQPGMDGRKDRALGPRFVVDFLFFVFVLIVLMNIIFGQSSMPLRGVYCACFACAHRGSS